MDASVLITLAEMDCLWLLSRLADDVLVPAAVDREVTTDPAASALATARSSGDIRVVETTNRIEDAAAHLGVELREERRGDVALLALGLEYDARVVVTDDKPLRKACKALSIPVSDSIGVLIRTVERGDLEPDAAVGKLYAMDEVGARLSARLVRRAERLIHDASNE